MLRVERLTKTFGSLTAVDNVTFEVPAGQMVGIIGRSGAGKSTLLRMINRLTDATAGRIVCDGIAGGTVDVCALKGRALRQWRARCAMVFQQFNLVPRLAVISNVLMGRISYHSTLRTLLMMFSPQDRTLAIRALQRLDMVSHGLHRADELSGGLHQRARDGDALLLAAGELVRAVQSVRHHVQALQGADRESEVLRREHHQQRSQRGVVADAPHEDVADDR